MDLDRITRFLVLAQTEHLGRAAKELRIPQSSLSGQIRSLEQDFGVALVEKAGRGLRLTEAGRVLATEAQELLAHFEAVRQQVLRVSGGLNGTVRIGIPDLISVRIAEVTEAYTRRRPDVIVRVEEAPGAILHRMLMNHEVDLAVIDFERVEPPLVAETYLKANIYAFFHQDHELSAKKTLSTLDLAEAPLLLYTKDFAHRAWLDAAFQTVGVIPKIRIESTSAMTLLSWASRRLGVAVMATVPELLPAMSDVVHREVLFQGRSYDTRLSVAWDSETALSVASQELRDALLGNGSPVGKQA